MFSRDKSLHSNTRQYSGKKVIVDELQAKVAKIGALDFVTNVGQSTVGPEIYVSESGSDMGNGSQTAPYASISQAFKKLSQMSWDGRAVIYIDGTIELPSGDYDCPFAPLTGISGKPYSISIVGQNVSCEGPFTVDSMSTWGPAAGTREDFTEVTVSESITTAAKGKMVHFLTGNVADQYYPIYSSSGSSIKIVVPAFISAGDTFEICTLADTLSLTGGGRVPVSSLARLPVFLKGLIIKSDGANLFSEDQTGYLQLQGVEVQTPPGQIVFEVNLRVQGLWVNGSGYLLVGQVMFLAIGFVLLSDTASLSLNQPSFTASVVAGVYSESPTGLMFSNNNSLFYIGLDAGALTFVSSSKSAIAFGCATAGMVVEGDLTMLLTECTGADSGLLVDSGVVYAQFGVESHDNTSYGVHLQKGARMICNQDLTGSDNGVAGIFVESGSSVRLPSSSTIAGPVGPATDSYKLNGAAVAAAGVTAVDASDLAEIGFY